MADQSFIRLMPRHEVGHAPEAGPAVESEQAHEGAEPDGGGLYSHTTVPVASTQVVPVHQIGVPAVDRSVSMY